MMRRRVAYYGGTFDPVHKGHLAVARRLVELFALEAVVFIPAMIAPHKRAAPPASGWHRVAMLALATQNNERLRISTVELDQPARPFTVETLAGLKAEAKQTDVRPFFVMGADSWSEIRTWREWERVLTMIDHIVVTRPESALSHDHVTENVRARIVDLQGANENRIGEALIKDGETKIFFTDAVMMNISATNVRRRAGEGGKDLDELVPLEVARYIRKYELYVKESKDEFFDAEIERESKRH